MDGTFRSWRRGFLRALLAFLPVCSLTSCSDSTVYLDQGWSDTERTLFYYTTQGSRLIRRDWFLALERHDSEVRFLDDGLKRFGYLQGPSNPLNPDKLPIGFAVDPRLSREWIGMTCAACHTSDITYGGKTLRVDGAPASADMYEFLSKLDLALQKAANDDAAFLRFAEKVLGANNTPANRQTLRDDSNTGLKASSTKFANFVTQSKPASPWGPARLDAFGMIFNRVVSINLGIDTNSKPPNAPVSYPFLWGTSWHDWTQWNGAVPNGGLLGPIRRLARNVGQVLGVFGTIDFTSTPTYPSSAQRANLLLLEQWVSTLKAPPWPDAVLGAPDQARVDRGKQLYLDQGCIGCHKLVPKDQQLQSAEVKTVPVGTVGTDDAMTTMVASRSAPSAGILQGRPMQVFLGRSIGSNERVTDLLSHAVIGTIAHISFLPPGATAPTTPAIDALFDSSVVVGYKARPLNGIWATGPYLHNGSVRTLFQVLLPVARREASFHVGGREFDPVEVGFKNAPGIISFQLDTSVAGNRKTGHSFADGLTDAQRMDLVEYLKTL